MKSLINTLGSFTLQHNDSELLITKPRKHSILNTVDTGFEKEEQKEEEVKPEIPEQSFTKSNRKDSILESIETGFGEINTVIKDCPKPQFKTPLFKEDYLSVFISETEKQLVRNNIGVIGAEEVTKMVKELVAKDVSSFITIEQVEQMIQDLDFVDSKINSRADYTIPDKLFKL